MQRTLPQPLRQAIQDRPQLTTHRSMKNKTKRLLLLALLALTFLALGCTSTRNENGVQIQKQRNWNPLNYIPYL